MASLAILVSDWLKL